MEKKSKTPLIFWLALTGIYLLFIFVFTYLYPMSEDEMFCVKNDFSCFSVLYLNYCARFSNVIKIILMNGYKWAFLIVNPLAQLSLVLSLFYLANLRLPNFKTFKDLPEFILIALASVFLVSQPDQTIFWLSGSVNYLMLGVMFIAFCGIMRKTWHEPDFIPSNTFTNTAALFAGIILGMNNENSAPMIFCLCGLYTVMAFIFKRKIPFWFIRLFIGVAAGLALMFASPVYHKRTNQNFIARDLNTLPLNLKMQIHLSYIDNFLANSLYVLPAMILSLFILLSDKFKTAVKNEYFLLSALSCFISIVLAFVFFPVHISHNRIFYSASLFTIAALLFLIKYIKEVYKLNLTPYFAAAVLIFTIYIFPAFTRPYISLYRQSIERELFLKEALKAENTTIYLKLYETLDGPTRNLTIDFYDPMMTRYHKFMDNYYGREFTNGNELKKTSDISKMS